MKPQQPDVAYCIKHAEFVNGLREKRRGWQEWDWGWDTVVGELIPPRIGDRVRLLGDVWIPTSDDVLGMLGEEGVRPMLWRAVSGGWLARGYDKTHPVKTHEASGGKPTPLIALLELLRAVEKDDG